MGCTHDYLREQTELVSNLQERLYFAEVHVFEENIAHSLQGLRFSSKLTATHWETIKLLNYLNKPGLSISVKWVSNTEDNIAILIETIEYYKAQINLILDKMKNIQTRINKFVPRTEKLDKVFSQLELN